MDPLTIALTAASFGGKLLSGIGGKNASAKQGRLQMMEDERIRALNEEKLDTVNARREALGRELLTIEESHTVVGGTQTDRHSWVDVDAMMAAAERYGVNPATFLQAGGLSAYTQGRDVSVTDQTTTSRGHNAAEAFKLMMPDYSLAQPTQIPVQPSNLSIFGDALSAGASTFGTQARAAQSYDLQMAKLLQAQALQGMGISNNAYQMTLPVSGQGGFADTAKVVGGLSAGNANKGDDKYWPAYEQPSPVLWDNKTAESTNPINPAWGWKIPPGYSNAESWEDTFGELVSWPYGAIKFANTAAYNLTGNTVEGGIRSYASGKNWDGSEKRVPPPVVPYVPAGMPASIAYPSWARP